MSRSTKNYACHYVCQGSTPKLGKIKTSKKIRRKVRVALKVDGIDFDFFSGQDKIRGWKGNKDWGDQWKYFGDGFLVYWDGIDFHKKFWFSLDKEWVLKQKRK